MKAAVEVVRLLCALLFVAGCLGDSVGDNDDSAVGDDDDSAWVDDDDSAAGDDDDSAAGDDDDSAAGDDDDSAVGDDDDSAVGDDDDSAGNDDDDSAGGDDDDSSSSSVCGDSQLQGTEQCDDGNGAPGDGCDASCMIEPQCTAGCTSTADCISPAICVGNPAQPVGSTGQCEDTTPVVTTQPPCSSASPCPAGQACLGEFAWGSGGWCVDGWFAKDFYSYDDLAIPDGGATVSSSLVACGLATVPVDIVVTLHLDHPRPEDLLVELEDPNNQLGTVLDHQPWVPGPIVTSVGSGDAAVNGEWTLHVTDTVSGESGRLVGWSVYLLSNWD